MKPSLTFNYTADEIGRWVISRWPGTIEDLIRKCKEEFNEFLETPNEKEFGDCLITLFAWAIKEGVDPYEALLSKFESVKEKHGEPVPVLPMESA